jgi:hypothetical protein
MAIDGLGPYSRSLDRGAIGDFIDGRSWEAKFLKRYEAMLIKHLGGKPSLPQAALIIRCARVALHLELMDRRSLRDGHVFGIHDHNYYVSWSNSLARLLAGLGVGSPEAPELTIADIAADRLAAPRGCDAGRRPAG